MSPETREFLATVRDAEDPTLEDQRRVADGVRAAVALGAAGVVGGKLGKMLASAWGVPGVKAGVTGVCIVVVGGAAALEIDSRSSSVPTERSATAGLESAVRTVSSSSGAAAPPPSSTPLPPDPEPDLTPPEAASPEPSRAVSPPGLSDELALLARVQADLRRGDGARALDRLEGDPNDASPLLAERRAAEVLALCAAGRVDEAREKAAIFLHEHPRSPQRAVIERSCTSVEGDSTR